MAETTVFASETAIQEVRALARDFGAIVDPVVVADRSNLVLRLDPLPLVARVAMATSTVRVGMAWLRREMEIAEFLAHADVLVTRPSERLPAGPHERAGLIISFWQRETLIASSADPRAAGEGLAAVHAALVRYPHSTLPLWGGVEEARVVYGRAKERNVFDDDEVRRMEAAWERGERIIEETPSRSASFQAVHGDAHIGNVLATERGAVWTDWEDAFVGPIEWDIACLRSRAALFGEDVQLIEAMTAAYSAPYNRALVEDLALLRNLQVIPWLAIFAEREPELIGRMRARIARLPP